MTLEQKELLLKDLCSRLPYGVKFRYKFINNFFHEDYTTDMLKGVLPPYHIIHSTLVGDDYLKIEEDEVKPYLFPLSSMTEEQKKEFDISMDMGYAAAYNEEINCANRMIDFFNKNHFDYRGLIPKGLALDATNLNIY